jgi:hypothetical protein
VEGGFSILGDIKNMLRSRAHVATVDAHMRLKTWFQFSPYSSGSQWEREFYAFSRGGIGSMLETAENVYLREMYKSAGGPTELQAVRTMFKAVEGMEDEDWENMEIEYSVPSLGIERGLEAALLPAEYADVPLTAEEAGELGAGLSLQQLQYLMKQGGADGSGLEQEGAAVSYVSLPPAEQAVQVPQS